MSMSLSALSLSALSLSALSLSPLVLDALLLVATVCGAGMVVPQVVRLQQRATADGVSPTWVGVSLALNLWWASYFISQARWALLPLVLGAAVLYAMIVGQLSMLLGGRAMRACAIGATIATVAPAISLAVWGWSATGLALGFSWSVQFAPAAVPLFRRARTDAAAPATWVMALVEAVILFGYGLRTDDLALIVGGFGGSALSLLILLRLASLAGRRPRLLRTA